MNPKDFLNPTSMITPGVAGGLTTLITNTLHAQFGLQQKWVALVLSFMLGTLVFSGPAIALWKKLTLYLLNSLIIFSMALGANVLGQQAVETPPGFAFQLQAEAPPSDISSAEQESTQEGEDGFFQDWY